MAGLYIGTSGWHYNDWLGLFYPEEIKGYNELKYHSQHFNTVENNSSFYRISKPATYKTWYRYTPPDYKFSIKVNKFITHTHKLSLTAEVQEKLHYIIESTQELKEKLGAIVIQLPASFRYDLDALNNFLAFFTILVRSCQYPFDIAIEFRNKYWFVENVYEL